MTMLDLISYYYADGVRITWIVALLWWLEEKTGWVPEHLNGCKASKHFLYSIGSCFLVSFLIDLGGLFWPVTLPLFGLVVAAWIARLLVARKRRMEWEQRL